VNRPIRRALLAALFALLLAACGQVTPMDSFAPAGPEAHRILNLSTPVFIIAGVIFLLVEAAIVATISNPHRSMETRDWSCSGPSSPR